jgi:hypothetical protein
MSNNVHHYLNIIKKIIIIILNLKTLEKIPIKLHDSKLSCILNYKGIIILLA